MKTALSGAAGIVIAAIVLYVLRLNDDGTVRDHPTNARQSPAQLDSSTTSTPATSTGSEPIMLTNHIDKDSIRQEALDGWTYYYVHDELRYRVKDGEISGRPFSLLEKRTGALWQGEFAEIPEAAIVGQVMWDWYLPIWFSPTSSDHYRTFYRGHIYEVQPQKDIREWYPSRRAWVAIEEKDVPDLVRDLYQAPFSRH